MNNNQNAVNAIRVLAAEAVQKANSGHPGLPLGAADMAFALWDKVMIHNPNNPKWDNRDRFILSAGHGSALIYSLLHLYGYGVTKEDLMNFRQVGSKTPGHPEYGHTVGVETTTGPLGQGIANGVGMAMAERHMAEKFNKDGYDVVDHNTFVIVGDGCLMEGISYEAASLAGTLGLGKLVVLYDSNRITIEGHTDIAFTENVAMRFEAMDWDVITVDDGHNVDTIAAAIEMAKKDTSKPSIVIVKTIIGKGAPGKEDTHKVHGEPLGDEVLGKMKESFNWTVEPFCVPEDVKAYYEKSAFNKGGEEDAWKAMYAKYEAAYPELAAEYKAFMSGEMKGLDLTACKAEEKKAATRAVSGSMINKLADLNPNLIGGSADLAPSNKTNMDGKGDYAKDNYLGRNLHFGVREHAMGAIMNGMALHGGLNVYGATFMVFSDYVKPAIRLSALMGLNTTYVFTHDSIGVGEDGPTHQPIEHMSMLRTIPGLTVLRPGDYMETACAWQAAMTNEGPHAIVLTRQNLDVVENSSEEALKGGYVVYGKDKPCDVLLIATGSEVTLAIESAKALEAKGVFARVVSLPSWELFEAQNEAYKLSVIPREIKARVTIEAGTTYGWAKYAGTYGEMIGIDTFGASGPGGELFKLFGFTVENVCEKALKAIENAK